MYQTSLEVVSKWRQNGLKMAKIGGNGMFEKNPHIIMMKLYNSTENTMDTLNNATGIASQLPENY